MTIPVITAIAIGGSPDRPRLVLGPSLGTSAEALWSACAASLREQFDVVAWDLPGHGASTEPAGEPFTMSELAIGVERAIDRLVGVGRGDGEPFTYAGVSVGGAVGLELMLIAPHRVTSGVLICTGARIGEPQAWVARAELVRDAGTSAVVDASVERWFGPGFVERQPHRASALLDALRATSRDGYARVCDALASYDVRVRLTDIDTPVLAIAGSADVATPVADLAAIIDGVVDGRLVVLDGVGHLAPAERPLEVARLIIAHVGAPSPLTALGPQEADR